MVEAAADASGRIDPAATLVVTRPQPDADRLCAMLRARGRRVLAYPVIATDAVDDDGALRAAMARLDEYRLVVFVSPNAIRHALAARDGPWPRATTIGVMGPGSRATLAALGIATSDVTIVSPSVRPSTDGGERFDSESLFATLDDTLGLSTNFDGRVLILRGNGGRAWFADRLRALGIAVDEVEAYRRYRPQPDADASRTLRALFTSREPLAFIVTSSEGLANLVAMVERSLDEVADASVAVAWLRSAPIVVPHRRIAEEARRLGFSRVSLCGAGDRGILAAIE